jgi:hypothetical protein
MRLWTFLRVAVGHLRATKRSTEARKARFGVQLASSDDRSSGRFARMHVFRRGAGEIFILILIQRVISELGSLLDTLLGILDGRGLFAR